jgi:uncharacterized membrane protein (DUF373 family)
MVYSRMTENSSLSFELSIKQETLQKIFEGFGKVILLTLLTISFVIFIAETMKMVLEFIDLWKASLQVGIQAVVVDTLTLLALFEIYLTILTYFKESRVKVTYVVDSVFIIMLSELLKQWFTHQATLESCGLMIGVLLALAVIRLFTIRYSPSKEHIQ